MADVSDPFTVYLEEGDKWTFAGAVEWPGWCRRGKTEEAALQALVDAGPRYEQAMRAAGLDFAAPSGPDALTVVERLQGTRTTDFGAPDIAPQADDWPLDEAGRERLQQILEGCWQAFDGAVAAATGKALRTGPRGGGRDLQKMVEHVLEADKAYLRRLGWPPPKTDDLEDLRREMVAGLAAAARGELPAEGPRGGKRWGPRYFVRRVAWHALDHAWELQDRIL